MPDALPSPVDRAYARYETLTRLLDRARQLALGDPTHQRNIDLGLTEPGQKRLDARRSIEDAFNDLTSLINHLALLDMAGAFERHFRERLATAIGEARKVVRERYRSEMPLYAHREGLVRDAEDFQALIGIEQLIAGRMAAEIRGEWEMTRKNRNDFAHGTDIRIPPTITSERARETLNAIIETL
jgi:hypothetical protein